MQYISSKRFDKQLSKFSDKIKNQCIEKIEIFIQNPYNETLNTHNLGGKYQACKSIQITGDIRIIYEIIENDIAYFLAIGTHSELYK